MNYVIQEVMPGQIVVQFEDGSRAVVGVETTTTAEEIDYLVSQYDPDFLQPPSEIINEFIKVGESRTSSTTVPLIEVPEPEVFVEPPFEADEESVPEPVQSVSPYTMGITYMALKMAENGDRSGVEALERNLAARFPGVDGKLYYGWVANYLDQDTEQFLEQNRKAKADQEEADSIFEQAMMELENE